MNTVQRIFEEVNALPEFQAREVLDFVGYLKTRQVSTDNVVTDNADDDWAEFEKYAGAWSGNFNRDECYDRPVFR